MRNVYSFVSFYDIQVMENVLSAILMLGPVLWFIFAMNVIMVHMKAVVSFVEAQVFQMPIIAKSVQLCKKM